VKGRPLVLLSLSGEEGFTGVIFNNIRKLSQNKERDLLVHIRDTHPNPEFVMLLASLHEVHFILLKAENIKSLELASSSTEMWYLEGNECRSGPFEFIDFSKSLFSSFS
jgi:hypothetical protein